MLDSVVLAQQRSVADAINASAFAAHRATSPLHLMLLALVVGVRSAGIIGGGSLAWTIHDVKH